MAEITDKFRTQDTPDSVRAKLEAIRTTVVDLVDNGGGDPPDLTALTQRVEDLEEAVGTLEQDYTTLEGRVTDLENAENE